MACPLGRGRGEDVAVSFIGGGGASLLDGSGHQVWRRQVGGNAWSVGTLAGPIPLVAVDDGSDGISLFDAVGNPTREAAASGGSDSLVGGDLLGTGEDQLFGATTTESAGQWIRYFDRHGTKLWEVPSDSAYAALDPTMAVGLILGRRMLVHGDAGGDFRFYDASGKRIGQWQNPERDARSFCLLPRPDNGEDLVVYSSSGVTAYRAIWLESTHR